MVEQNNEDWRIKNIEKNHFEKKVVHNEHKSQYMLASIYICFYLGKVFIDHIF